VSRPAPSRAEGGIARRFHDDTAHTPHSVRTSTHTLDWDVKPFPFKVYPDLEPAPLPRAFEALAVDTLLAVTRPSGAPPTSGIAPSSKDGPARLTLSALASILYHAAGVTKKKTYPGGAEVLFRAAPSTGALYQTEVYVAAGDVDGVSAGLYHFCPGDFALRRLRGGDVRAVLAEAAVDDRIARTSATVILTAIFWRNTWKYQARGYRHLFWDSGTMLANLLAASATLGAEPRLCAGFVDSAVNRLLGLDPEREAALELVTLGPSSDPGATVSPHVLETIAHRIVPLSSAEVDYPALREIHRASSLDSTADVATWRGRTVPAVRPPAMRVTTLPPPRAEAGRSLSETIERRGSTREFSGASIGAADLATVLRSAAATVDADVDLDVVDLYVIVNAVDGIAPGAYVYRTDAAALEQIHAGDFRRRSAHLCLDQSLGGDAAAVIYFLAPLDRVLASYGDRGYRVANLAAGLAGGRAYLAAYALGFGATGLTFYDREVVEAFSPHAAGKDALFVTAIGRSRSHVAGGEAIVPVVSRLDRPRG
jgi:SagB-type dehydrogenase family enzyme